MIKRFVVVFLVSGLVGGFISGAWGIDTSLGIWSMDYPSPVGGAPALDSQGKYHFIYSWGTAVETQQLWYTESDYILKEWTTPTLALTDMADQWANMFLGDKNRYHSILNKHTGNNYQFYYIKSDDGGKTWSYPPSGLSNSNNEAFNCYHARKGAHVYFIWDDNRNGTPGWTYSPVIYFRCSYDNGDTWEPEVRLSPGGGWYPKIVVDSHGTLHANWQDGKDGAAEQYYSYSTDQGKTWSSEMRITEDDDIVSELSEMLVGPDDRVHLFWLDQRPPNNSDNPGVYHSMSEGAAYNGASAWTAPEKISDFTPPFITSEGKNKAITVEYHHGTPTVCVRDGVIHLLWANYRAVETPGEPPKDISFLFWCYSRNGGDTWTSPNCIDNIKSNSAAPHAELYKNTLALFWRDDRTGTASIWVKFLDKRKSWPHEGATLAHTRHFDSPCTPTAPGLFWPLADIPDVQTCLTEDINADGLLDLVTVNSNHLTLYNEYGDEIWQADPIGDAGMSHASSQIVPMIDIADLDGDTRYDVLVSVSGIPDRDDEDTTAILVTYSRDGFVGKIIDSGISGTLWPMNSFDIDDDSKAEILCGVESNVTSCGLILFNGDNGSLFGRVKADTLLMPRVVSDINNDGNNEIVCAGTAPEGHVYARAFDEKLIPLWTRPLGSDGNVFLSEMPSGSPPEKLLVTGTFSDLPGDGQKLAICNGKTGEIDKVTTPILSSIYKGEIASADIDSDHKTEILCTTTTDTVGLFDLETLSWDRQSTETLYVRCVADVNCDGEIEVIGSKDTHLYILDNSLNLIEKVNALYEIKDIIVSDFGTDNINEIIVITTENVEIWRYTSIEDIASRLRRHLLGAQPLKRLTLSAMDFNDDDRVDVADFIKFLYIMN